MTKNIGTVTVTDGVANVTLDTKDLTEGTYNIITRYPETNTQTEAHSTAELNINPRPKIKIYTPCPSGQAAEDQLTEEQLYCTGELIQYMKDNNITNVRYQTETGGYKTILYYSASTNQWFIYVAIDNAYTGMKLFNYKTELLMDLEVYPNTYTDNGGGSKPRLYCYTNTSPCNGGGVTV